MAEIKLKNVTKKYGANIAVNNINLTAVDREFLVLVGPSGCGKTTTLRMIAGLEEVSEGEVYIGERPVLVVSTAHWSKFAADVVRGLEGIPEGRPVPGAGDDIELLDRVVQLVPDAVVPPQLEAVRRRPVRFTGRVEHGRDAVEASLRAWLAG